MRERLSVFFGFFEYVGRRFVEERCFLWAGMLTYASLLTLVPALVVILAFVSAFPVFEQWAEQVERFILSNFMPAAGRQAREYLVEFVARARDMSLIGVGFLITSVLLLMFSIDTIINQVWRVHRRRSLGKKFLVYWAVLTIGPILMGVSIVVSTNVIPQLQRAVGDPGLTLLAFRAVPVLISFFAFSLVYLFVPNVRVSVLHAAVGGLLSALLFEGTKRGFALYIREFPAYEVIYGAFAVVPIFLVWTYLVWIVLLLGACFSASLGSYARARPTGAWSEDQHFLLAYRVLHHLWNAQHGGGGLTPEELLDLEPDLDDGQLMCVMEKLEAAAMVVREESGEFRLVRDLRTFSMLDLRRSVPLALPDFTSGSVEARPWLAPVQKAFADIEEPLQRTLGQPLSVFLEESQRAEESQPAELGRTPSGEEPEPTGLAPRGPGRRQSGDDAVAAESEGD